MTNSRPLCQITDSPYPNIRTVSWEAKYTKLQIKKSVINFNGGIAEAVQKGDSPTGNQPRQVKETPS